MARKNRSAGSWLDEGAASSQMEEVPRVGAPTRGNPRGRKVMRRVWVGWVITSLVLTPLLGVAYLAGRMDLSSGEVQVSAQAEQDTLAAQTLARQSVMDWLAAEPSPLPGGMLMSWNGATPATEVSTPEPVGASVDPNTITTFAVHDLTVATDTSTYSAQVTIATSPAEGVRLVGSPTLVPYAPSTTQGYTGPLWPGAVDFSVTPEVTEAVNSWAEVFVGNSPERLRLSVDDPAADHSYLPLLGASLNRVDVVTASVTAAEIDPETGKSLPDPDTAIVRVELSIAWPGQIPEGTEQTKIALQPVAYDVLIQGASTASPRVVAWGGPGSGPDLAPYANAVTGRTISVQEQTPTASQAPDETPTLTPTEQADPPATEGGQ